MIKEKWLIWSIEHNAWWKANRRGYTQDMQQAGGYDYEDAINIVAEANRYRTNKPPNEAMIPFINF